MSAELSPLTLETETELPERQGPPLPQTTQETINTIVHYYRGELGRMAGWRDRIDRTSNWAITVVAAMLSVSLSTPSSHHGVLLFAMLLITLLLLIEARRYRFFDVYRARVRQLERGYFAQILSPEGTPSLKWSASIAKSLRKPAFLMTYREAVCRRLQRNYCWMYLILLLAWALKISSPKISANGEPFGHVRSWTDFTEKAALGPLPGWAVMIGVALFYVLVLYASLHKEQHEGELAHGEVHV
ncbi:MULTISPECIES: DUF2270 domain-containing protein [unclassified Sinorhizobium]|uniref:DUF2270 domain-containing protein n=1 Tax=unclassified Sinorhizobium TaxID=2613772 RepID=UPI0024C20C6B|nr:MULTISPECIES: DUF2270 domain-containing protein [unclassified Sinorhizobium]MDK1373144.1 DUF2270 domain-containing protein [Sinorhizobium sp. 6-70]MDK1482886.1 DUF2270 domain-containing protein [Sinorhizobium sp. 6-117]